MGCGLVKAPAPTGEGALALLPEDFDPLTIGFIGPVAKEEKKKKKGKLVLEKILETAVKESPLGARRQEIDSSGPGRIAHF